MAESINETITDRNARNFDKEYEELNKQIEHIKVGSQTLMLILEYVIEFVEKIENVKGNKKKGIALLLIKRVVENAELEVTITKNKKNVNFFKFILLIYIRCVYCSKWNKRNFKKDVFFRVDRVFLIKLFIINNRSTQAIIFILINQIIIIC